MQNIDLEQCEYQKLPYLSNHDSLFILLRPELDSLRRRRRNLTPGV